MIDVRRVNYDGKKVAGVTKKASLQVQCYGFFMISKKI